MTRRADWYGFHAHVDPIDTADQFAVALADPDQRWYARRRSRALCAAGLIAATQFETLHPRGRDGKFIEKFGWVRWFDDNKWHTGWVSGIDPNTGVISVREGNQTSHFPNPKDLYARPKPKARLDLPNLLDNKPADGFKKIGGQGGSNPGGMFEVDKSFAADSPDLSSRSYIPNTIRALKQPGTHNAAGTDLDPSAAPANVVPQDFNTVVVPRLDGTQGRYDVLTRLGPDWYRVPASGTMTDDDVMRPELKVDPVEAFGEPGSARRHVVLNDLYTEAFQRGQDVDVEDVAEMFQQSASPLPKVGDRYYVKTMNIPERARNEALANDFYELLGIPVPDVAVGADGKTISSKLVGNTTAFDPNNPAHVAAAQEGFVADAWLSNWDVIGLSFDNIQIDADGRAWRIDAGGALAYRAQGKPKGAMFGDQVGELSSLRNKSVNAQSAKVYGGITQAQLDEQAKVLQAITPDQIQALADAHEMPHLGPVLIARRKNVLDQLGIPDPPPALPEPGPPPPKTVFNPVEAVQQMGNPPTVAVSNWNHLYNGIPSTTIEDTDWGDTYLVNNAVFKKNGDLWVYDGDLVDVGPGVHTAKFHNLFSGEQRQFSLYDGEDEFLDQYTTGNIDSLVDQLTPQRDLAIAEIVARANNTPLANLTSFNVNADHDPPNMQYSEAGLPNWNTLTKAWEGGRLGPNGPEGATDWPLRGEDNSLWEIVAFNPQSGIKLRRRDIADEDGMPIEAIVDPVSFEHTGPWFRPLNDTTAAVWKSKYAPETPPADLASDPDHNPLGIGNTIDAHIATTTDPDTPTLDSHSGDDGIADIAGAPDTPEPPPLKQADPDLVAFLEDEQAAQMAAAAPTGVSQKVTNDVVDGLGASQPILSTEMTLTDFDQIKADLLNKSVVVLPIEAHDNPDWEGTNLGTANGLGTVIAVEQKQVYVKAATGYGGSYENVVALKVQKANSTKFSWVVGGDSAKFKKVVIPVATDPQPSTPTFKQNGDIFLNGEKVGTYWKPYSHPEGYGHTGYAYYTAVIDGDHSVTGKPMHVQANKQGDLKIAANAVAVPIAPKPTKPKSTKVTATEDEIKKLNADLADIGAQIDLTNQQLDELAKAGPTSGNPLNDGSNPQKGDWVFSTKDGSYAQVLNPTVVGFAGKGVVSPDMVKVKIQDPVTGKWKQSNRKRDTLVSVAKPGDTPFVMQTKAVKSGDGKWIGPGTGVYAYGSGNYGVVLDTTVDGKVKVSFDDGSQKWMNANAVDVPVTPLGGGTAAPTLKQPAGTADADALNAQLAALNDQYANLAATIAGTTVAKPKKKKEVGTPFPGPAGKTVVQPKYLAEQREAKGLKNTKDGYVPTPGMILRHNDGTQYVVMQMGDDWSSHKNSVYVASVDNPYDYKWRAVSTMVLDHDAMLTDANGDPLPIISTVDGADWSPQSGMLLRKKITKSYYVLNPGTGKNEYRTKEMSKYYVVAPEGTVYNMDGTQAPYYAIQPGMPIERIGYIDKDHQGGKKLTVSVQQHHVDQVGKVDYVSIHDPNEPAAIPVVQPPPTPTPTPSAPAPPTPAPAATTWNIGDQAMWGGTPVTIIQPPSGTTGNVTVKDAHGGTYNLAPSVLSPIGNGPSTTPPPTTPTAPTPTPQAPGAPNLPNAEPTPTDELPVFNGKNPSGMEAPHPPTTSSSKGVPAYTATGGPPTLDVAGVPGAHSVTASIAETIDKAKKNQGATDNEWVGTYGMADHDVIEDMLVQSQVVRDGKGNQYVEVRFRVEDTTARANFNTFITSTTNESGDWEHHGRNAKNLVPGDYIAVRVSGGGGATVKGGLRPDGGLKEGPKTPNAQVIAAPVLIGKNKDGTFDVYRTQVMTAGGDIGFIDVEDRSGVEPESLYVSTWDPTKPRTSNGAKGLNPNAAADGWTVKSKQLQWDKAGGGDAKEHDSNGVKKVGEGYDSISVGAGWTLQRDYQGAHVEYRTTDGKNSLDGQVVIRVPVDDPAAQQKIADAMELVGVSKEAQKPPDRDAVIKMATDKVWEQFNPTWTKGKKPNSPQQALDAIDNAVGKALGRKATLDDISIRVTPDGRVQVLVSEDVSRAIVKTNGIKHYTHRFSGGSSMENTVVGGILGENPGLLSTTERWNHGLFYQGMSSSSDHANDAAGFLFLRMSKSNSVGSGHAVIDAVTLHRHVDYYWQPSDTFGKRQSNQLNWLNSPSAGGSNELMLQRRLEVSLWSHVVVDPQYRQAWLDKLHKKGITHAPNGMLLEDFFVTSGGTGALAKTPPSFGDEIPLSQIPGIAPTVPQTAPTAPAAAPELVGV